LNNFITDTWYCYFFPGSDHPALPVATVFLIVLPGAGIRLNAIFFAHIGRDAITLYNLSWFYGNSPGLFVMVSVVQDFSSPTGFKGRTGFFQTVVNRCL